MKFLNFEKIHSQFNRLSKREKMILVVTLIVIMFFVTDRLLLSPVIGALRSFNQQGRDLEASIKKSMRLLAQKDRMMKEAEQYASYQTESKSPEEEAVGILKHIEELADHSSVNLLYVKPAGSQLDSWVKKFFVSLEFEGQMEQVVRFFYEIESSKFLLRIEKYALQPTAKGSSVIKCSATVSRAVIP